MKVIVCLDDNNGMMFNNRRQSKDETLRCRIIEKNDHILMNEYSYGQFSQMSAGNITVCDDFLDKATDEDTCFVENSNLSDFSDKITAITVYRWNRSYPYDMVFDLDLSQYTLTGREDFAGNSHENITEEVYIK